MPYGLLDEEEKKLQYGIPTISGESVLPQKIEKNEVRIQPAEKSDAELSNEYIKQKYLSDKAELEAAKDESRQRRMGVGILDAISGGLQTITGAKAPNYANSYAGAAEPVEDVRESQKNWKSNPSDPRNVALRQSVFKNPKARQELMNIGVDPDNFTYGSFEEGKGIYDILGGIRRSDLEFGQKMQLAGINQAQDRAKEDRAASRAAAVKAAEPATSDQSKAALFGSRMEQAEKEFGDISAKGYDRSSLKGAAQSKVPEIMKPEMAKRQDQAERNFLNAVLRRESGAAISPSEFESGQLQYFPRVGDSPEVLEQKKRNRELAQEGLKVEAGKAYDKLAPQLERIQSSVPPSGGMTPDKQKRLQELRQKRDAGTIK